MSIADLLKLNGEDFVKAAYETILSRSGTPEDVESYMRAMAGGLSKADVLLEMNRSPEGRSARRIASGDLFNQIFECGAEAFIGFPAGETRLHRKMKLVFKKLLWSAFRYELWNLYFSPVLAYEALERADACQPRVPRSYPSQLSDGAGASSLPYGVWKTLKELEA